jgi:hypothetical protein
VAVVSVAVLWGCTGPKPRQVGDPRPPDEGSEPEPEPAHFEGGEVPDPEVPSGEGAEFDEEAAKVVLNRGAKKATECAKVNKDIPSGEGSVDVVFDGAKGRVVDVEVGGFFSSASENAQSCIKNAFIGEIIPPFAGNKTVPFTVKIP